jgi:hypothetical protein
MPREEAIGEQRRLAVEQCDRRHPSHRAELVRVVVCVVGRHWLVYSSGLSGIAGRRLSATSVAAVAAAVTAVAAAVTIPTTLNDIRSDPIAGDH